MDLRAGLGCAGQVRGRLEAGCSPPAFLLLAGLAPSSCWPSRLSSSSAAAGQREDWLLSSSAWQH